MARPKPKLVKRWVLLKKIPDWTRYWCFVMYSGCDVTLINMHRFSVEILGTVSGEKSPFPSKGIYCISKVLLSKILSPNFIKNNKTLSLALKVSIFIP